MARAIEIRANDRTGGPAILIGKLLTKIIGKQRKSKHSLRTIVDAIFWLNYTGVQWREMKEIYPPWETVYYHFRRMKLNGIWEQILQSLVALERKRQGKEESPSLLSIDSQSVKTVQFTSFETGIDAGPPVREQKNQRTKKNYLS